MDYEGIRQDAEYDKRDAEQKEYEVELFTTKTYFVEADSVEEAIEKAKELAYAEHPDIDTWEEL